MRLQSLFHNSFLHFGKKYSFWHFLQSFASFWQNTQRALVKHSKSLLIVCVQVFLPIYTLWTGLITYYYVLVSWALSWLFILFYFIFFPTESHHVAGLISNSLGSSCDTLPTPLMLAFQAVQPKPREFFPLSTVPVHLVLRNNDFSLRKSSFGWL